VHIGYWWENQKERDHAEDEDNVTSKIDLREMGYGGMD
jgi:hypothetical protein